MCSALPRIALVAALAATACAPPSPAILRFVAEPAFLVGHGQVTLTWLTQEASSLTLADAEGLEIPLASQAVGEGAIELSLGAPGHYTYVLTAHGEAGSRPAKASVHVEVAPDPLPVIDDFFATPGTEVASGTQVLLQWRTTHATRIQIGAAQGQPVLDSSSDFDGLLVVTPTTSTSYELIARGSGGEVKAFLRIAVVPAPLIASFRAEPRGPVTASAPVVLSWSTEYSNRVTIADGTSTLLDSTTDLTGTLLVHPDQSSTYTLRAWHGQLSTQAEVEIEVLPEPRILSFESEPEGPVAQGQAAQLRWLVLDAHRVRITDDTGAQLLDSEERSGRVSVTPARSQRYTLTAEGPGGSSQAELALEVLPGPAILAFSASPGLDLAAGTELTLSWQCEHSSRVRLIDDGGLVLVDRADLPAGSHGLVPTRSTRYTLLVDGAGGQASAELAITVWPSPIIDLFAAEPGLTVSAGTEVTLTWRARGAVRLVIQAAPGGVLLDTTTEFSGSLVLVPATDTVLTLLANNPFEVVSAHLDLQVGPSPAIVAFTSDAPSTVDAGAAVTLSWVTQDATRILILDDTQAVLLDSTDELDGQLMLHPDETTTLTLLAENQRGSAAQDLVVSVHIAVETFALEPLQAHPGTSVHARWVTTGASSLELFDERGTVLCGAFELAETRSGSCDIVAPLALGPQNLTLVARNRAGGSEDSSLQLQVTDGPRIMSFAPSASAITVGQSTTLTWSVSNDAAGRSPALILTDDHGGSYDLTTAGQDPGSLVVTPAVAGRHLFTLSASAGQSTPSSAELALEVVAPVQLLSFTASPDVLDSVSGPTSSVLSWQARGGARIELWALTEGNLPVEPALLDDASGTGLDGGSIDVDPVASTRYRLRVSNLAGQMEQGELRIVVDEPAITSFIAAPPQIAVGASSTLTYIANARTTAVTIDPPRPPRVTWQSGAFVDISGTGTSLTLTEGGLFGAADEGVALVDLPSGFQFPFDGGRATQILVTANGYVSLDAAISRAGGNQPLPTPGGWADGVIAPFWDDLYQAASSTLHHALLDDQNGQRWVVQWSHWTFCHGFVGCVGDGDLTFQVTLWADGSIGFAYGQMVAPTQVDADGASASLGFENRSGSDGLSLSYDTPWPGGLGGGGWIIETPDPSDSFEVTPSSTTTYQVCATDGTIRNCRALNLAVVQPGAVMFSEMLVDPAAVPDDQGEWLELTNASADDLTLDGWTLSTGSGGSHILAPSTSLRIPAGGVLVLGRSTERPVNGGAAVDYAYGTDLLLDDTEDTVWLHTGSLLVDQVHYDASWPLAAGAALSLDPGALGADPLANDLATAWCVAVPVFGDGDLGTPGVLNPSCP